LNRNALASPASVSATTMMLATGDVLLRFGCAANAEGASSTDCRAGPAASSGLARPWTRESRAGCRGRSAGDLGLRPGGRVVDGTGVGRLRPPRHTLSRGRNGGAIAAIHAVLPPSSADGPGPRPLAVATGLAGGRHRRSGSRPPRSGADGASFRRFTAPGDAR
jgi:hypothetical protein